jgi:hypothetical protein
MDDKAAKRIAALTGSPLFPFEGNFVLKQFGPPMATELARDGEGDKPCHACAKPERALWTNGRWQITELRPSTNPAMLFLETVAHLDFESLDETMAAEFGILTWRLEAAVRSLESVGRVHIHRWGDGSSHFHVWFQGRPARQLEMYGYGNVLWPQLLDPLPAEVIAANHQRVINHFTGTAVGGSATTAGGSATTAGGSAR